MNPCTKVLQQAKFFLVAQIIFMDRLGKCCNSDTKSNKNLKITLEVCRYDSSTSIYSCVRKTGLLTGSCTLIACISNEPSFHINDGNVSCNHEEMTELEGYLYHEEMTELEGYLSFHEEANID